MTEAQIKEFANTLFDEFDSDKSGSIDVKEVRSALERIAQWSGSTVSEADVVEAMKALDTNNDGVITKDEFLKLVDGSLAK